MKFVLIAFILSEQLTSISMPVAAGISAEFDDLPACQAAQKLVLDKARLMRARQSFAECMAKSEQK